MIQIHKEMLNDIPVLHVVKEHLEREKTPLILFIHGFESAKEHNLHYAYLLADKGFRVVLPEIMNHGEREAEVSKMEMMFQFWEMIIHTIDEIEQVKNYYVECGLVDVERIGVAGTSMGGIITCGALTRFEWIKAAVVLMGSPNYEEFALSQIEQLKNNGVQIPLSNEELQKQISALYEYDLSKQPQILNMRPILFWHGVKDSMVPYQPTYDFYNRVKTFYQQAPERLDFITDRKAGHKVSRKGLLQAVMWFERWL
ncbi:alpha/beta fold hydrolase [Bacillus sp. FJAT-49736]|uniref:alpha/beta fold hydrolase n=1 Tax=Bacillus sp. FJAT-49736 TaxID=2833582 RepID=UPI001BCA153F|nr:prolyl oligopeptidase family serine peptidase [Bacillus sp. FJAT-49736]